MARSLVIGLVALSTTILLIVAQPGAMSA